VVAADPTGTRRGGAGPRNTSKGCGATAKRGETHQKTGEHRAGVFAAKPREKAFPPRFHGRAANELGRFFYRTPWAPD